MTRYRIACIVEGHGEQTSVPKLVKKWLQWRKFENFEVVERAIRAPNAGIFKAAYEPRKQRGIEYFVEVALRAQPQAILALRDADDDCARDGTLKLGPWLQERAQRVSKVPVGVVIANREFEAWFLASLSRLRARGEVIEERFSEQHPLEQDGFRPILPERYRDCKNRFRELCLHKSYGSTVDQARLVEEICFTPAARRRAPSLDKFLRVLEDLARRVRAG